MNTKTPGKIAVLMSALLLVCAAQTVRSANVLFVSDNPGASDNAFLPPIAGFPDDFYVVMLQNAGHNVIRFNPPNSQNTLLTAAQLAAINTNDLIVVSRSIGSGGFQAPQSSNWNARVTKPLIMTSPYLVRQDGNRLFWFVGGNGVLPDTTPPTRMRAMDTTDPETAFLFDDVVMNGDTMADSYDEAMERNTSTIVNAPTTGGKQLATATFVPLAGGAAVTANIVTEFPAGTPVNAAAGGVLAGYRMFFAAGSRELSDIPTGAGRDNLSPAGEKIFMRAIQLALNNGVAPIDLTTPVGVETNPVSQVVYEFASVTFSVSVTGAPPRWVTWQRDAGDSVTFTNIPGAATPFSKSQVALASVNLSDNGALFRVVATNAFGVVTSEVAQLTVNPDITAPTITSLTAKWTMTNLYVKFSEPVEALSATDPLNYQVDNGLSIDSLSLDASGTIVTLNTTPQSPGTVYTLTVNGVVDRASTPNMIAENTTASVTAFVESRGFWITELFTDITAGNAVSMLTSHPKYPNNPDISSYINVSSNAPTSPNREQYGGRMIGWVVPPVDGTYTFYIRGDDGTELRFSPSADPAARTTVAAVAAANQAFTAAGASSAQNLVGGQLYFIEALWKEGTGGDYMQMAWTPPWSTNIEAIPGTYLQQNASPVGASVTITTDPVGASVEENRTVNFSVAATTTPPSALRAYQWQKSDGVGGWTNALGVQNTANFTTPLLRFPDDNGSQWRVIVSVPGASATSQVATASVSQDTTPPIAIGAGSIDGLKVGVCFNELVETDTATDPFNYGVTPDGGASASISTIVLRPDRRSVLITLASPISGPFTVSVNGINDLATNLSDAFELHATVVGLTGAELGANAQVGQEWSCDANVFEVIGGGADIFGTADAGRFDSRSISGDFDAKVRVQDLTLTGTGGALIAKAGLMVRATGAADSPTIWLLGNAPPPGRDLIEPGYRATTTGSTVVWANNVTNIHMPDMWMRLARGGNTVTEYASSNGLDWVVVGSTNTTLPQSVLLGVAVTAHNNVAGLASTGRFSNFSVSVPVADLAVSKTPSAAAVAVGLNATYTITVANNGPDTANLVTVSDPIVAGTTHVSSTASQGSCSLAAGVVTCNLGSIASGASATVTVVVRMDTEGAKLNTASVTSSTSDAVAGNNSASATVTGFSAPRISGPTYDAGAGTFSVSVPTVNGVSYTLVYKDALTDPTWTPVPGGPIVGDGSVRVLTDPGPLPPMRFYTVRLQ